MASEKIYLVYMNWLILLLSQRGKAAGLTKSDRNKQGRRQEFQKGGAVCTAREARREIFQGHALLGAWSRHFPRFDQLKNKYFLLLI